MDSEKEGLVIHRLIFPVYVSAKSLELCSTLCDPLDCSQGTRILDWVAMLSSRDLLDLGIELASLMSPALAGRFFTSSITCDRVS